MTVSNFLAQGDILLVAVTDTSADLKAKPSITVAEGEVTGHHHVLEATSDETELLSDVDAEFVRIMGANALLTHPEHDDITVPPGTYKVVRQFEYHHGESIRVQD
jgi:hypothetical protein